jgi:hypothetical protein
MRLMTQKKERYHNYQYIKINVVSRRPYMQSFDTQLYSRNILRTMKKMELHEIQETLVSYIFSKIVLFILEKMVF